MYAKNPTLAWLLTALACFLTGMAIVESRYQAVALPVVPPVGVVVTVEVSFQPTPTLVPTPRPTPSPTPNPLTPTPEPGAGRPGNIR